MVAFVHYFSSSYDDSIIFRCWEFKKFWKANEPKRHKIRFNINFSQQRKCDGTENLKKIVRVVLFVEGGWIILLYGNIMDSRVSETFSPMYA